MKPLPILCALVILAAAAGCTSPDESTGEERTRGLVANMPEGADTLIVDITARSLNGTQVSVLVDANGTILAQDSFDVAGEDDERVLEVATNGSQLVGVQLGSRADVTIHLVLHAVLDTGERVVLRDEWFGIAA